MHEPIEPKAFVSYAWSSAEHKQKVIELASKLRENGVDVRLDRWHLREGNDANAFMESMVTDPEINKIILIFDKVYCEKADGRLGGVGKETQIVTSKLYASIMQDKFVGVVFEQGQDGKPYRPAYYGDRIYIDLSSDNEGESYITLLRWLHGQPADVAPPIGLKPHFLATDALPSRTTVSAIKVDRSFRGALPDAGQSLEDYLDIFLTNLADFQFVRGTPDEYLSFFDKAIEDFVPIKCEWVKTIRRVCRSDNPEKYLDLFIRFFESALAFCFPSEEVRSYLNIQFDHYKFFAREIFLDLFLTVIEARKFEFADALLSAGFFVEAYTKSRNTSLASFELLDFDLPSLYAINERSSTKYYSLHGKIIQDRANLAGLRFEGVLQADLLLFLRSQRNQIAKFETSGTWHPATYPYLERTFRPLEIFARTESEQFLLRFIRLVGAKNPTEYKDLIKTIINIDFGLGRLPLAQITGYEKAGSKP